MVAEARAPLSNPILAGAQEFFGREFKVEPSVLIPRPETELLVEVSLDLLTEMRVEAGELLDVGTGRAASP